MSQTPAPTSSKPSISCYVHAHFSAEVLFNSTDELLEMKGRIAEALAKLPFAVHDLGCSFSDITVLDLGRGEMAPQEAPYSAILPSTLPFLSQDSQCESVPASTGAVGQQSSYQPTDSRDCS